MRLPTHPEAAGTAGGFVLPLALVFILVVATLSVSALDETATQRALSDARLFQQRAVLAAAAGLELALAEIGRQTTATGTQTFQLPSAVDQARVDWRRTRENPLPAGFSTGHFVQRTYEIRSAGTSLRNAQAAQVQAVRRVEAVAVMPTAAGP